MKYAKTWLEAIREAEAKGELVYADADKADETAFNFREFVAKSELVTSMISRGYYDGAREICRE